MKFIFLLTAVTFMSSTNSPYSVDFGKEKDGKSWQVILDGVMGGLSTGKALFTTNTVTFSGTLSLENNGGFSSYRAPFGDYDLSNFKSVQIKYRSKGGIFGLMLERYRQFYYPYHTLDIPDTDGKWSVLESDLTSLNELKLADKTGRKMTKDELAKVIRIGIMKLDKKEGPFEIEIDYIKFMP